MTNKEIQEKRMKDYFILATKEILKGEGLKSLSVRNIADRAGYSFATIYNYFRDVNDLVFLCVNDFQEECRTFVTHQAKKSPEGQEKIKAMAMAYINYFVEYPGIFELFYLTRVSDFGNKQPTIQVISTSLDSICEPAWEAILKTGTMKAEQVEMLKSQLRYTVVGLLLLYMNRRSPDTYKEFIRQANAQISSVLGLTNK